MKVKFTMFRDDGTVVIEHVFNAVDLYGYRPTAPVVVGDLKWLGFKYLPETVPFTPAEMAVRARLSGEA